MNPLEQVARDINLGNMLPVVPVVGLVAAGHVLRRTDLFLPEHAQASPAVTMNRADLMAAAALQAALRLSAISTAPALVLQAFSRWA